MARAAQTLDIGAHILEKPICILAIERQITRITGDAKQPLGIMTLLEGRQCIELGFVPILNAIGHLIGR